MTYELSAVVAGASLIEEMTGRFQHAVQVPLAQGLALIPAGGQWLGEVGWSADERQYPPFECLSGPVAGLFAEVADVRADGLEDPQAQQPEHGDQGEAAGRV